MKLAIAVLASLGMSAAAAAEQKFPATNGVFVFGTPSGNVTCLFVPRGGTPDYQPSDGGPELSCYRALPTTLSIFLRATGKAQRYDDEGDIPGPSGTLRYGNTWSRAGFTCKSSQSGLTCTRGKNGFFISKAKTSVY